MPDMPVDDSIIPEYYVVEYMGGAYVAVPPDYADAVVAGAYKSFVTVFVRVKVDVRGPENYHAKVCPC